MKEKEIFGKLLGKRLRQKRREQKMTLRELGIMADVDDNYLGKIERGQKNPSLYIFSKLSDPLELNLHYLIHEVIEDMEGELQ
ncbi:helix-turn-helix domain-containing protein [Virgibacillus senegalensis]|uniref:helix-turn-helix domain-containing protein n=1 Tax=Virgibacillus senegalensis TaxID=1499679 RepID=UPI00069F059F|nr:helix-turn-helix transcriptional regulator [Virgibacillus senegalensis]